MPERASRTHVVPGNIMSVEFKLFDIMTLKQFLYLVVCSFISYILFSVLPQGLFQFLFPAIIMISGIIIAFVQFNGEPFEVYTSNFLLGIIQPQRRVWSKTPIKKTVTVPVADESNTTQKALKSINENYVAEAEVIPVDYNKTTTDIDLMESQFLKTAIPSDNKFASTAAIPKADVSKLNFNFALQGTDDSTEVNETNSTPLIQLKEINNDKPAIIREEKNYSNSSSNTQNNQQLNNTTDNLNLNVSNMPLNNNSNTSISSKAPAFTIDMDDEDTHHDHGNDLQTNVDSQVNSPKNDISQDPQQNNPENMPQIKFDLHNSQSNVEDTKKEVVNDRNELILSNTEPKSEPQLESSNNKNSDDLLSDLKNINQPDTSTLPAFVHDDKVQTEMVLPNPTRTPINPEDIISSIPMSDTSSTNILGRIHGKVLSAKMNAMPGLVVSMCDQDGKAIEAAVTNEQGEFVFQGQPKSFQLKVYPPKKYLFSPMDKFTKEIIIHEIEEDILPTSKKPDSNDISFLTDANEVNGSDAKIPNTINGVVKDDEGHYLSGVLVSIKDINSGTTIRALATNPLGQFFSLSPLPKGKFKIIFEKDGYTFEQYTAELDGKMYNAKVYQGKINR